MKRLLIPTLCVILVGCNQTTSGPSGPATAQYAGSYESARSAKTAGKIQNDPQRAAACAEAAARAANAETGAAVAEGVLGMVGGVAGLGGRGSAMAGAAASAAGGAITMARTNHFSGAAARDCQQ